jgi:hypothetical protein
MYEYIKSKLENMAPREDDEWKTILRRKDFN